MINNFWLRALALCALAGLAAVAATQDLVGVSNFQRVNPALFRGAQPTKEGFRQLGKLGIKTVVDLREAGERSVAEKKMVEASGMRYMSVPMRGFQTPAAEQVAKVLSVFNDSSAAPVFVHCQRGADRTGTVVACYRIAHDGWENAKALAEARSLGMSWLQRAMQKYVLDYRPDSQVAASPAGPIPPSAPALALVPAN